jgi:hypothetical protein
MGISLLKVDYRNKNTKEYTPGAMNNFLSNIHRSTVDQTKAGDVFILVFKDEIGIRKIAHHAILVDVAGASNEVFLEGVLLHLTASSVTRLSQFRYGDKQQQRSMFHEITYIGKIMPPPYINASKVRDWACYLMMLVSKRIVSVMNILQNTYYRETSCSMNLRTTQQTLNGQQKLIAKFSANVSSIISVFNGLMICRVLRMIWFLLLWI